MHGIECCIIHLFLRFIFFIIKKKKKKRSRDLELEGGVIACHVDYVYEPRDSHVRGTE